MGRGQPGKGAACVCVCVSCRDAGALEIRMLFPGKKHEQGQEMRKASGLSDREI